MPMGKHGIIEDSRKRCKCGRIKPAARAVCYTCKPRYSRKEPPESIYEPYTLPDRVAQARAVRDQTQTAVDELTSAYRLIAG